MSFISRVEKVIPIPGRNLIKIDYQGGTNPIYVGYNVPYAKDTDETWLILKITWDANDNPTIVQTAIDKAWDDRTTINYQ